MKRTIIVLLAVAAAAALYSEPISQRTYDRVVGIGLAFGVPESVTRQLMIEESGDRKTGALGNAAAVSRQSVRGHHSRGLFQLYDEPRLLAYLLAWFWPGDPAAFDIMDPLDNAVVALGYLAALHKRFGNWLDACTYYNCGRVRGAPPETLAYARRIINAR